MKFNFSSAHEDDEGFAAFKDSDAPKKAKIDRMKLRVQEVWDDDIRGGISWVGRISRRNMESLGVHEGDVIQIRGQKKGEFPGRAVVKCRPLLRSGGDMEIIMIDGLVRNNAGVWIGDLVEVSKVANAPAAILVVLEPILNAYMKVPDKVMSRRYLNEKLAGAPLATDSFLLVPYLDGRLTFKIAELHPAEIALVDDNTEFRLSGEE